MVHKPPQSWDRRTDVIVVGSGTGLSAALAASENGADVLVLEKSPYIGGTTATSGGGSWVSNSHVELEQLEATPREEVLTYLKQIAGGITSDEKLERYVDDAPAIFEEIEELTPLEFLFAGGPADYHAEFEGGQPEGRMIVPDLYHGDRLGDRLENVRDSPPHSAPDNIQRYSGTGGEFDSLRHASGLRVAR